MKKIFKIFGILLLIVLVLLISIPFFLESKIDSIVQNYADENLEAKLSFDDISLSLISSFPKAEVSITNLEITTLAPFENETLVTAKSFSFEMPLGEIFNSADDPFTINEIIADELLLTLKTNAQGNVNYDIVKAEESQKKSEDTEEKGAFSLDIEHYELNNSAFTYIDESSNTNFYLTGINHNGNGIFSGDKSELETKTEANISLAIDSSEYFSNNTIKLDALIDLDLENQKYSFKENKGFINSLPLEFDGFLQMVDAGQLMDISFKNPESSFKDFLAVIPKTYTNDIENVKTTGNFTVNGKIEGLASEKTIPKLDIKLQSSNASFKFPDLPKSVKNIEINASVKNTTGLVDDTYIDINKLNFQVDEDKFKSEAHIKNLTKNMIVNANLDGILNLANITKAYPIELENELSGILRGTINTAFDMNAIETNAYDRVKNTGNVSIENFIFSSDDIVNPIHISNAGVSFKPGTITLDKFDAKTGKSDISANGSIKNLIGFLLSDKNLQGIFNVKSKTFAISDFMVEGETTTETSNETASNTESLKIPEFLECTINADAETVIYDNLNLKNVKGKLLIKDQNANLVNMTTDLFNGKMGISGNVSTANKVPKFDMNLAMQQFDISQSFKDLDLLKALAPIANVLQGKLNSTIKLNGNLSDDFTPDLASVTGDALAELLTTEISENKSAVLQKLDGQFDFIDLKELDLDIIKTKLAFEKGQVSVKPFDIKYKDIPIEVSGTHGFDNSMDYNVVLQVPAKYLGSDVNRLIGKIDDSEVDNISVPVTANLLGSFTSPTVKTDLTSGVTNLTKQLIDIEKQKLIDKGKEKVTGLIGGILNGKNEKTTDSTIVDSSKTKPADQVTEGVKNILGGFLKKKKKTTKAQDSTKN